jgi:hypothetical protein
LGFGFFWGDDYGGGYFVLGFEVEELDALGAAAGGADGFGVDADDLAELADDNEFGAVVDELDARDLAYFGVGLHVDDALPAFTINPRQIHHQNTMFCRSFRSAPRPEILKPGFNQSHNNSKDHRSRNAEHKRSVCCFQRSHHFP